MTAQDVSTIGLCSVVGLTGGWLLGGPATAVAFMLFGAGFGLIANRYRVRAAFAVVVFAGALVGALIGARITHVLCLPGSCRGLEVAAALLTGIGAFVGVGLVAALVGRSFDEYNEATASGRPPPTPGCESEESDPEA